MDGLFKVSIPDFLRKLSTRYMIIGGRAYNLLLNNPVLTYDYDIKVDVDTDTELFTIRNQLLSFLEEEHQDLDLVADNKPGVARIIWHSDVGTIDVVDFSTIGPEHQKPGKYQLTFDDRIHAPNGLYYGNLTYLLRRLEELTEVRHQDYLTVQSAQEQTQNIVPLTREIMQAVAQDSQLNMGSEPQLVIDIVSHLGESEEIDNINTLRVKKLLDEMVDLLIDSYDLEDDPVLDEFTDYDQESANQYVQDHPLDLGNPRDLVIAIYQQAALINLYSLKYIDVNEKRNKYLRTRERLESFYKGISNPYEYFSKFFLRLLEEQCQDTESLELFTQRKFECQLLKQ